MKRILIIDDDEDLVDVVKYILITKGFHVQTHPNSQNVSDVVKNYNPDLIFLDIRLYGESGTDICRELKRKYNIPIILFSADTRLGEAFADCDADGFLEKPFDLTDLLHIINQHLQHDNAVA
ncbi:MAG: response regulator [Ginsengibacter sp.]